MERVPRSMDRHLQRIMGNATGSDGQNRSGQSLNYPFGDARPAECGLETAPRLNDDPMLLNELGKFLLLDFYKLWAQLMSFAEPDRGSYVFESSRQPSATSSMVPVLDRGTYNFDFAQQPSTASGTAPTRLSLAPQGKHNRKESEPRVLTNADNHFRFAQNLRQGVPMNRAPPPPPVSNSIDQQQAQSPLTQLVNSMLLERPISQARPEQMNHFHSQNHSKLSQLQPRRQEITPPFNLS